MGSGVSSSLETLFNKMENFVTTKTVVGDPVNIGDVIILPLVDISFGVGAGGSMKNSEAKKDTDNCGGFLGAKITPSAVIVIMNGQAQMLNLKNQDSVSKLIDMVPNVVQKLNLGSLFDKKDKKDDKPDEVSITNIEIDLDKGV